jgi:hypothetical protein
MSEVYNVFTSFWNENIDNFPFGHHLENLSSLDFWTIVKKNCSTKYYILAADFALRLLCAGTSSCGVERIFSYIRWILGTRRYRLCKTTLEHLLILKERKNK